MEFDDITRTESELPAASSDQHPTGRTSALPWILLFVTVAVFIGTTLFLWFRTTEETNRANQAYVDKTKAEARAVQAESLLEGQKTSNVQLSADMKLLSDRNADLDAKVRALEAKAQAEKPAAKAAKKPAKKPVKKKRR